MVAKRGVPFLLLLVLMTLVDCGSHEERRIQLSRRPGEAMSRERVRAVRMAVAEKVKIAILPLTNEDGRSDLSWLSQGLADMLAINLSPSRRLNLMTNRSVAVALERARIRPADVVSPPVCRLAAEALGADVLVTGRFFSRGDTLKAELNLWQGLSGEKRLTLECASPTLDIGDMFRMIAPQALRIRAALEESGATDEPESLPPAVATRSLEAYRLYLEGMALMEGFLFPQALEKFKAAVAEDSTFALACFRLAVCYYGLNQPASARPWLNRALQSPGLSDRERLPILAMKARVDGDLVAALRYYEQYARDYPEDALGHMQLGEYYFGVVRDYRRAVDYLETVVDLDPQHKLAYNLLAYSYAYLGDADRAFEALDKYTELAPDEANPQDSYGEILQRFGRVEEAVDRYKAALKKNRQFTPAKLHLISAYLDLGKVKKARRLVNRLAASKDPYERRSALPFAALIEIADGNPQGAEQLLKKAPVSPQDELWIAEVLLKLDAFSAQNRSRFLQLIEAEESLLSGPDYEAERLFRISAAALEAGVGFEAVNRLLGAYLEKQSSPLASQIVSAYRWVFFLYGIDEAAARPHLCPSPEVYQSSGPIAWNYYWKYFYKGLAEAARRGANVRPAIDGFCEFSRFSGNPSLTAQEAIVQAAGDVMSGRFQSAAERLVAAGRPVESDWRVIGPFDNRKGLRGLFWPEECRNEDWEQRLSALGPPAACDSVFDGYLDLHQAAQTRFNHTVYALLPVYSPAVKKVMLHFGANGRLKVWSNGELLTVINQKMPAFIDHDRIPARLAPGLNLILVRVDASFGELGFYFRITDFFGKPIRDLMFGEEARNVSTKTD